MASLTMKPRMSSLNAVFERELPDTSTLKETTIYTHTHDDPDWTNLTYGDDCANGRAGSLKQVTEGDILLFWGMLWGNRGSTVHRR
jgi:hypothetical protein